LAGSVIFDPETGFGGNGTGDGGCVVDGPFANLTLRIKEDLSASEYCLTRNLNHCMFKSAAQSNVDSCFAMDTFEKARQCLEGMPHGAGHGGVGALVCQPSATGSFYFLFLFFMSFRLMRDARCSTSNSAPGTQYSGCITRIWINCGGNGSLRTSKTGSQTSPAQTRHPWEALVVLVLVAASHLAAAV
jgi:hypothetical protein